MDSEWSEALELIGAQQLTWTGEALARSEQRCTVREFKTQRERERERERGEYKQQEHTSAHNFFCQGSGGAAGP